MKKITIIISPVGLPENSVSILHNKSDEVSNTIYNSPEELIGIITTSIVGIIKDEEQ